MRWIKLLAVMVIALSSGLSEGAAVKASSKAKASKGGNPKVTRAQPTKKFKPCTVAGTKMLSMYEALSKDETGTLYATCVGGVAKCFKAPPGDSKGKPTECPATKSANASTTKASTTKMAAKNKGKPKGSGGTQSKQVKQAKVKKQKKRTLLRVDEGSNRTVAARRLGMYKNNAKWPDGLVCYKYERAIVKATLKKRISEAAQKFNDRGIKMAIVEENECEKYLPRDLCDTACDDDILVITQKSDEYDDDGKLIIDDDDVPYSEQVGKYDGGYEINMPETITLAEAIHEFGHAMGLLHEHAHPDAEVVQILGNIGLNDIGQYVYDAATYTATRPYDPKSIMHYPPVAPDNRQVLCYPSAEAVAAAKKKKLPFCRVNDHQVSTKGEELCVTAEPSDCTKEADKLMFGYKTKMVDADLSDGDLETLKAIYGAGELMKVKKAKK